MDFLTMALQMDFTGVLEILVAILVAIEIVELFYNMRAIRTHENELDMHLEKLEAATSRHEKDLDQHMEKLREATLKLDNYINCVNHLDQHIKTIEKLLEKTKSEEE
jgi:cell division protein ZapA (FtsZ GTPase activity inhibitor)